MSVIFGIVCLLLILYLVVSLLIWSAHKLDESINEIIEEIKEDDDNV